MAHLISRHTRGGGMPEANSIGVGWPNPSFKWEATRARPQGRFSLPRSYPCEAGRA